jgi:triacylglycerol lipase
MNNENIQLQCPVLFIHGAGFRERVLGIINYWGRIPELYSKHGIKNFYGGTDSWGTIEKNSEVLKNKITDICQKEKTHKVNIIAHSRGGLEARYIISSLGMDYAIASLTTISTPHYGVKAMNVAANIPAGLYTFVSLIINCCSKLLGDKNPDFFTGSRQLSERNCSKFNASNPDSKNVFYQSYAAKMRYFFSDPVFIIMQPLIKIFDGDNDGLCPVESAKWGDFKGVITTQGLFGISHSGIIDAYRIKYKGTDITEMYLNIARDLSKLGF